MCNVYGSGLGRRWQALAPADRVKYEEIAGEDRERYKREKKEFEKSRPQPPESAKPAQERSGGNIMTL